MILSFRIQGVCSVLDPDLKPKEVEIADAIETVLNDELDLISSVYVSNMREEY